MTVLTIPPLNHLAATPRSAAVEDTEPDLTARDVKLHDLCEAWASWCYTRRYFAPAPSNMCVLGRMAKRTRPLQPGGPDAPCSAEMASLHLAILAQPREALDRQVFELYYVARVRNVKAFAAELGISRRHWYTLLSAFRIRIHLASVEIMAETDNTIVAMRNREFAASA
jgi:hypothetical protein